MTLPQLLSDTPESVSPDSPSISLSVSGASSEGISLTVSGASSEGISLISDAESV